MISVLLAHPAVGQLALKFPDANKFQQRADSRVYQITQDQSERTDLQEFPGVIVAEVPMDSTLYIGTVDMTFVQPGAVPGA